VINTKAMPIKATHIKITTTATATALTVIFAITALGPINAQAQQRHWFYNDYDRYDERAYDDDGAYDEDDGYPAYAPPSRRWLKRQQRLRRLARERDRRIRNRSNRYLPQRANRLRLYDAWQNEPRQNGSLRRGPVRLYTPPARQVDKSRSPIKLTYVPLPRTKPYHLTPAPGTTTATTNASTSGAITTGSQPVKTTALTGKPKTTFDQRPNWNPAAEKILPKKKDIKVTALPKIITPTPAPAPVKKLKAKKTTPERTLALKPIRIEVAKAQIPGVSGKPELTKTVKKKPSLAANQLSCNKAKSIVSDFGFSDIIARTCTGNIYDFSAKRDGSPYSIKVSSLSGELKGVKKIK